MKTLPNHLDDAHTAAQALRCVEDFVCYARPGDLNLVRPENFSALLRIVLDHLDTAHRGIAQAVKPAVKAA